jgi:type I restriction enzyme S subunit
MNNAQVEGWALVTLPDVCDMNPPKPSVDVLPPDAPVTFVPMPAVDAEQGAITNPLALPFLGGLPGKSQPFAAAER